MKRYLPLCLLALFILISCGEKKDAFVIEGTLNNLGGRPLYAIYPIGERIVTDTLRPDDGRIAMEGYAEERIPVQLYNSQMQPIMRFYLQNGDRIEIKRRCPASRQNKDERQWAEQRPVEAYSRQL